MSAAGFTVAAARLFAVCECHAAMVDAIRAAMDAEIEPSAKAAVWDRAAPLLSAINKQSDAATAAFHKAKKEAGL